MIYENTFVTCSIIIGTVHFICSTVNPYLYVLPLKFNTFFNLYSIYNVQKVVKCTIFMYTYVY